MTEYHTDRAISASCLLALIPFLAMISVAAPARAQALPNMISFQGFLTDGGGIPINGNVSITFKLYKGATAVWTETQPSVNVADGVYNVVLGSVTPFDTVSFNRPMDLGVKVGADPEITPRTSLLTAPYSLSMRYLRSYPVGFNISQGNGPSLIGGHDVNGKTAIVHGATIAGGGAGTSSSAFSDCRGTSKPSQSNWIDGDYGTIGGGLNNLACTHATISGGQSNRARGQYSSISGGVTNRATGYGATVAGGERNRADGYTSFAAGYEAKSAHDGTFVWNDRSITAGNDSLVSTGANQFLIRAAGGVAIGTNSPRAMLTLRGPNDPIMGPSLYFFGNAADQFESGRIRFVEGTSASNHRGGYIHYDGEGNNFHIGIHSTSDALPENDQNIITIERNTGDVGIRNTSPGFALHVGTTTSDGNGAHVTDAGAWTNGSSETFKTGFRAIDKADVLNRLASLPVTEWSYRGEENVSHIGPTAESFRAAFGLGHDERYITTVDADGVALAAIQGLYELVKEQQAVIAAQGERLAALEARE